MENTQTNGHDKQRVHWTQTPEGRLRIAKIAKQRWKNRAYKKVVKSMKRHKKRSYISTKTKNELAIELLLDQLNETAMRSLLKRILLNR